MKRVYSINTLSRYVSNLLTGFVEATRRTINKTKQVCVNQTTARGAATPLPEFFA